MMMRVRTRRGKWKCCDLSSTSMTVECVWVWGVAKKDASRMRLRVEVDPYQLSRLLVEWISPSMLTGQSQRKQREYIRVYSPAGMVLCNNLPPFRPRSDP
jgi:hypothetical protein